MNSTQKQERLQFVQEQIVLLRGYLSNPDSLLNISADGITEQWVNRTDILKELRAYEREEERLLGTGGARIRYADTRRAAGR